MSNCLFGYPVYSDPNALVVPTFAGGSWLATADIAWANVQDRRSTLVARSTNASLQSTRRAFDLKAARRVGVIAIPYHSMSQAAKVRVLGQTAAMFIDYEAGDDLAALGATVTRSGAIATYRDSRGIMQNATANVPRDGHFVNGKRGLLREGGSTNLALQSGDWSNAAYSSVASPTVTANYDTAPDGTLTATRVQDTHSGSLDGRRQTLTIANDASAYAASVFVRKLATAPTTFPVFNIRLSGGTTVDNYMTINAFTGAIVFNSSTSSPIAGYVEDWSSAWWRITVSAVNNSSGNTSLLATFFPAWSGTLSTSADATQIGEATIWGLQIEPNRTIPASSYIPTTAAAASRSADVLTLPASAIVPGAMTGYMKLIDYGYSLQANATPWSISNTSAGTPYFAQQSTGGFYHDGVGQSGSSLAFTQVPFDVVETNVTLDANADVIFSRSVNGGATASGSAGTTATLFPATFSTPTLLCLGGGAGWAGGDMVIQSFRLTAGVQTMTTMRAAVYDSGWLDVWPQVFPAGSLPSNDPRAATGKYSAEDALGVTPGFVHVPATPQVFQFGSIQIDDSQNAAGSVDIGRLMITGAYQPSLNMVYGAKLGLESNSIRTATDGGTAQYNRKQNLRYQVFTMESMPDDEMLVNLFDFMRRYDITDQFFFVFDAADTYHMHRRSFPCVMRELSPLEFVSFQRDTVPIAVIEDP